MVEDVSTNLNIIRSSGRECSVTTLNGRVLDEHRSKGLSCIGLDTIAGDSEDKVCGLSKDNRPKLQSPVSDLQEPQDFLKALSDAFSKAFNVLSSVATTQSQEFVNEESMVQSASEIVLQSTKEAMDKQSENITKSAILAEQVKQQNDKFSKINKIMGWIGLGVVIVTVLISTCSFLSPFVLGALAGAEAGAVAGEAAAEGGAVAVAAANNAQQSVIRVIIKKLLKAIAGSVVAGSLSSPQLVWGIAEQKIAGKKEGLALLQEQVGEKTGEMERNGIFLQGFQQNLQRDSSVLREETEGASQVISTFGDIQRGFQEINRGLADAVSA